MKALERENKERRKANEILKLATPTPLGQTANRRGWPS
jgi:hypothetical protein